MDEIELYDVALSKNAVQELYGKCCKLQYNLEEATGSTSVADSSGSYRTGTVAGNPQSATSYSGNWLSFDGNGDYINAGYIINPVEAPFSAFAWVKGGGAYQHIICQSDSNSNFTGLVCLGRRVIFQWWVEFG